MDLKFWQELTRLLRITVCLHFITPFYYIILLLISIQYQLFLVFLLKLYCIFFYRSLEYASSVSSYTSLVSFRPHILILLIYYLFLFILEALFSGTPGESFRSASRWSEVLSRIQRRRDRLRMFSVLILGATLPRPRWTFTRLTSSLPKRLETRLQFPRRRRVRMAR